jgi:hypothetical protein
VTVRATRFPKSLANAQHLARTETFERKERRAMRNAMITATLLMIVCTTHAADTDKTLVSWVTITDKNVRAGSVLTIQRGAEP